MDTTGLILFFAGILLFFLTGRKHAGWMFVAGLGAGIVVAAIWAYSIVTSLLP